VKCATKREIKEAKSKKEQRRNQRCDICSTFGVVILLGSNLRLAPHNIISTISTIINYSPSQ
jgi:hypothetical protein